jgi:FkbM family methyltransferase
MQMEQIRWIYRAWRYRLKLEKQEITCLRRLLRPGDAVVDIGAHKGAFTYWMQSRVTSKGMVFAFEPQPVLFKRLEALVNAGRNENVVVENLGLSSARGTMTLNVPSLHASPGASFEASAGGAAAMQSYPVKVTTLDDYFDGGEGENIRLIKCDAEGHELEIFKGGENLLRRQHPHLLFECENRHRGDSSVSDVFSWLESLDYRGYYITDDGTLPIDSFDPAVHQADNNSPDYVNNFLFSQGATG